MYWPATVAAWEEVSQALLRSPSTAHSRYCPMRPKSVPEHSETNVLIDGDIVVRVIDECDDAVFCSLRLCCVTE